MKAKSELNTDHEIVIVTGPAGAGRTTAIHALEDFGFEAIDNLPLALFGRLMDGPPLERSLAIGVDPRTRGFSVEALLRSIDGLPGMDKARIELLYVDCSTDVLLRRFSETRRRHPSARDESPRIGVEREQSQLLDLKARADYLVDTSEMSPHDLKSYLSEWFAAERSDKLSVSVQSFGFKRGAPRGLDMCLDLRFLRNPHWDQGLRPRDGREAAVARYIKEDPLYEPFTQKLLEITSLLLPAYKAEGKSYFSIGLGCTGGQHRSVFMAETLGNTLAEKGWQVSIRHRELERGGTVVPAGSGRG